MIVDEELVLQMPSHTAPPLFTPTDLLPQTDLRSTLWASTQSPAALTPSTAQWPPTLLRALHCRDAWVKPAPCWAGTHLHLVFLQVLWLAETLKQQLPVCHLALWWGAARQRVDTVRLMSWALPLARGASISLPRLLSQSPHSCQKSDTCPVEMRTEWRTRTWCQYRSVLAARLTCLGHTLSQTSPSLYTVKGNFFFFFNTFHEPHGLNITDFLHLISFKQTVILTSRWMSSLSRTPPSTGTSQTSPESKVRVRNFNQLQVLILSSLLFFSFSSSSSFSHQFAEGQGAWGFRHKGQPLFQRGLWSGHEGGLPTTNCPAEQKR